VADLEAQVRATLADRAGRLEGPLPYAAPPALVDAVATRAAQLHRRRTLVRVGGAAAAVAVIGLAAATLVRGPSVAGPLGPAGSVTATATATRTVDSATATATATATRTVDSGTSGDTSAQAAAEDRIIRAALAADPAFPAGWDPQSQAVFGCGFYRVGASADLTYRYVWANCSMFQGDTVVSGMSVPLWLHVRGSGESLEVLGHEIPGDGTAYTADVRRLFPADLVDTFLGAPTTDIVRVAGALALRDAREQRASAAGTTPTAAP